tara:strand:+ start:342 stop:446 length:105 start_codon:yes stop_codon:yes gene_type:complete
MLKKNVVLPTIALAKAERGLDYRLRGNLPMRSLA